MNWETPEAVLLDFDRGLALAPEGALAYRGRAMAYRRLGNIKESNRGAELAIRNGYDLSHLEQLLADAAN